MQLNPSLDWDLSLSQYWPTLQGILAYGCQIQGTLSDSLVDAGSVLAALLIAQNAVSGTLSNDIFGNATNLLEIELSGNLISGVLPDSVVHLSRMKAFLLNDLKISGVLPPGLLGQQMHEPPVNRRSALATAFDVLSGPCTVNGSCLSRSSYSSNDICAVKMLKPGFLNATSFSTEYSYDFLSVGDMLYSGTRGPQHLFTPAGTFVNFSSDHYIEEEG